MSGLDEDGYRAGRALSTLSGVYLDYEEPALSLSECSQLLREKVSAWAVPYDDPTFNTGFVDLVLNLSSSSTCFAGATTSLAEILLYADLTWALPLLYDALPLFNASFTADILINSYFNSLAEIQAEPSSSNESIILGMTDVQEYYYASGLSGSEWSKSIFVDDNAAALQTLSPVGLLFPRTFMLLMYRRDVFSTLGLEPPATWNELLTLATSLNGSNFTGAGAGGGYGICLDLAQLCKSNFYVMAIAASMLLTDGLQQGLYMEPLTLAPLVDNAAMVEALRIFTALRALSPPGSDTLCSSWNTHFDQGQCAMTLEWDVSLRNANKRKSKVQGYLGFALLPGSEQVLNRSTGRLVTCTTSLCPYASTAPASSIAAGHLINRAPFSTMMDMDMSYNAPNTASVLAVAASVISFANVYLNPYADWAGERQLVYNAALSLQNGATPLWTAPPTVYNVTAQVVRGFNASDLDAFYPVYWAARWHPNPAADIAIQNCALIRTALEEAIYNVSVLGQAVSAVLPVLATRFPLVITSLNITPAIAFSQSYQRMVGFTPPAPPSPPLALVPPGGPTGGRQGASNTKTDTYIAVPISIMAAIVLVGLLAFLKARQRRRQTLMGNVMAPPCHADTTLLCTDIQNSTLLWESLEPSCMDAAVSIHHACLRRCMEKYSGYLSAIEGDSFIVAFHHPREAVLFATHAQAELLKADWPQDLLAAPDCEPVWVRRRETRPARLSAGARNSSHSFSDLTLGSPVASLVSRGAALARILYQALLGHIYVLWGWGTAPVSDVETHAHSWYSELGLRTSASSGSMLAGGRSSLDRATVTLGGSAVDGPVLGHDVPPTSSPGMETAESLAHRAAAHQAAVAGDHSIVHVEMVHDSGLFACESGIDDQHVSTGGSPFASAAYAVKEVPVAVATQATTWQEAMRAAVDVDFVQCGGDVSLPRNCKPLLSRVAHQVLVYNGLRVRMGMYSGVINSEDIAINRAAGNVQYSGDALESAKTVCSAAAGGMVLIAGETYRRLQPHQVVRRSLLVYAGEYHLDSSLRPWVLYMAAPVALPGRMTLAPPVKCLATLQLGTPSAPVGFVTVAFLYIVSAATLLTDIPEEARIAFALCHAVVTEELLRWGGYLVEAADGLVLATFSNSASAACWGLACQEAMMRQDWSAELLAQECCEEVCVVVAPVLATLVPSRCTSLGSGGGGDAPFTPVLTPPQLSRFRQSTMNGAGSVQAVPTRRHVLLRGLRLKVGLDVGRVTPDLNADTGRMSYRGRVMNRASRIASKASAGRVLSSAGAWAAMQDTPSPMEAAKHTGPLTAESLGTFPLKGLAEPQELFDCHHVVVEEFKDGGMGSLQANLSALIPITLV